VIQAVIKFDESVVAPQAPPDCLATDRLSCLLHEKRQQLKRLLLKADRLTTPAQLQFFDIQLEIVKEPNYRAIPGRLHPGASM
jgi:hypothetical protein